jgi:hypothetical protein
MFCPTCGRENAVERKFCASCGTNLVAVFQALSGKDDDFFTRIDSGLDHFLARYSEHVFRNAPGQSFLTTIIDLLLFTLMWNILPLRLLLLLISTPIRLITQRNRNPKRSVSAGKAVTELPEGVPHQWLSGSVDSVTNHTTAILPETERPQTREVIETPFRKM